MTVKFKVYKQPKLTASVKPGQILEALAESGATCLLRGSKPQTENPTNVFGYVRGHVEINADCSWFKQGEILVERLVPSDEGYPPPVQPLKIYTPNDNLVYFVVGELTNLLGADGQDEYTGSLNQGSVTLNVNQARDISNQLLAFSIKRGRREYVFEAPEGRAYSLSDIVLSMREK